MRFTATTVALAISSSLAAGNLESLVSASASTLSTKSSKSGGCTSCTAGTLTRSNMVTSLFFNTWSVDGYINQDSVSDYCLAEADEKEAFVQAVGYSAGCLVDAQCLVNTIFAYAKSGANFTEGEFGGRTINTLCIAEKYGVILPEGDCLALDPCLLGSLPHLGFSSDDWMLDGTRSRE